ncbi:hypothetical protein K435DRAFT_196338 [Dendrothele bispora CBS 962.96]|uniref:Uncharacterized protein n=1 Tax=Dendrothele bispora (strain CBS 962.96) TaxID=1314807 RepID=A0A4S8MNB5_DENBC|nr:hypothetical protein K435DRAFT_196338 [Dendrothele bispora CBS 962.96]
MPCGDLTTRTLSELPCSQPSSIAMSNARDGTNPPVTVESPPAEISSGTSVDQTQTASENNGQQKTLIMALPDNAEQGFRYAIVPLPETYHDAITAATRVFGIHLIDPVPAHIVLRRLVKNKKNEWVWADIDSVNWKSLVLHNDQVGVFKNRGIMENFEHGKIFITFGYKPRAGGPTKWTEIIQGRPHQERLAPWAVVDRPSSYHEALIMVKDVLTAKEFSCALNSREVGPATNWSETDWQNNSHKIKFYTLPGPDKPWREIHRNAYEDDQKWRLLVPMPDNILGVIVNY